MERRKFLIGAGALASGSAAAVGTGAFSSVEASRTADISVADDADAYLAFDTTDSGANSAYADTGNDSISVDLESAVNGQGANGINGDAITTILDIFRIRNQGTQDVFVYVDPSSGVTPDSVTVDTPGEDADRTFPGAGENDGVYVDPQASALPDTNSGGAFAGADAYSLTGVYGSTDYTQRDPADGNFAPEDLTISPGEDIAFGLNIQQAGDSTFPEDGVDITISADSDLAVDSS